MNSADSSLIKARFFTVMTAAFLTLLAGSGCGRHEEGKVADNRYAALGEVVAARLNEIAGGKGSVVLAVSQNDNDESTAIGRAIAAFRKTLDKSIQVKATETVTTPDALPPGFEPLPADKFAALLQKYADADYLVSFVGLPVLTPAQIGGLPSPRPQVVEVVAFSKPTKAMFAGKVVCLAVLAKPGAEPAAGNSTQESFDAQYQLVTPDTAAGVLVR